MLPKYYPASPTNIPPQLTQLPASYKTRAILAVLAIVLFFLLYFSLVAAMAILVYHAIMYPMYVVGQWTILMKLGAIAGSGMLLVFTLKFLFKLKNFNPQNRIKINPKLNPDLVDFVNQLCLETHAPKPRNIYVDPDVNAYVSYSNSWLSLILPVRKDLTIGLGLVECLTLSEFKAVAAHEFGHFAQRSMKIGSYVNSANTIIHDMIFTRDGWDRALARWRASDIRIAFAAWIITPVIWLFRQILRGFYLMLNILHSSLSREMEFNADKVAVSVTGSQAIVSGLWKLDFGSTSLNSTFQHGFNASQKNMFVKNLFQHNEQAFAACNDKMQTEWEALSKDVQGVKRYFAKDSNTKTSMYASHPLNDQREDSAKNPYVDCETDNRSPWLLFSDKTSIQEQVTHLVYTNYFEKKPTEYVSDSEFQEFIQSEKQGVELLSEFHNTFTNRFMNVPDEAELVAPNLDSTQNPKSLEVLMQELEELMKPVKDIEQVMVEVHKVAEGTTKAGFVMYKGKRYERKQLQEGYNQMHADREKLFTESFPDWDKAYCQLVYQMATKHNRGQEFTALCKQYNSITALYKKFIGFKNFYYRNLDALNASKDVTEGMLERFRSEIRGIIKEINEDLEAFAQQPFIPLPNVASAAELTQIVVQDGKIKFLVASLLEGNNVNRLAQIIEGAVAQFQRIDQKCISSILLFQRELGK